MIFDFDFDFESKEKLERYITLEEITKALSKWWTIKVLVKMEYASSFIRYIGLLLKLLSPGHYKWIRI